MRGNGKNQLEAKASATRIQRGLEERAGWWDGLLERPLIWAVLVTACCTWLLLPRVGTGPPDWQPGDVATFDLVIPVDITLPDEAATEAARWDAAQSVPPVYDLEPRMRVELEDEIRVLFAACRNLLESPEDDIAGMEAYTDLRETSSILRILENSGCA